MDNLYQGRGYIRNEVIQVFLISRVLEEFINIFWTRVAGGLYYSIYIFLDILSKVDFLFMMKENNFP